MSFFAAGVGVSIFAAKMAGNAVRLHIEDREREQRLRAAGPLITEAYLRGIEETVEGHQIRRQRIAKQAEERRQADLIRNEPRPRNPDQRPISSEERALAGQIKRISVDELIERGTTADLREVSERTRTGRAQLTTEQLEALAVSDNMYAQRAVHNAAKIGTALPQCVISILCKSGSSRALLTLSTAKQIHENGSKGTPFFSDQQLLDLSRSNDAKATKMVFDALSNDAEARHNLEPRESSHNGIVVHSKTIEIRPGTESTVFAASVESSSNKQTFLTTRDPLEMVLAIDNVLNGGTQFQSDPNAGRGILNTPIEAGFLRQLQSAQVLGLA